MTKAELIAEARELGCKSITLDGIVYEIGPLPKTSSNEPVSEQDANDLVKALSVFDEMTPDEILFWHSPYYDEIQENKKKHEEHLKNEALKNG